MANVPTTTVQTASQIMRRSLVTLSPGDDLFDGVSRLLRHDISGAPVVDGDGRYLGVLSEKACIRALTGVIEVAAEVGLHIVRVREFMTSDLVTLSPAMCVFDAIDHLLSRRISGAPVVDDEGRFDGVFSEKTAMRVLAAAMHDQLPGTNVGSYMNVDRGRLIDENDLLLAIARKFEQTPYRRLPVLRNNRLVGQVSRRDVLKAEHKLATEVISRAKSSPSVSIADAVRSQVVADHMDTAAMTASPTTDLLGITQAFLNSPYRRLPIVDGGRLLGQISRRDLLQAAADFMTPIKQRPRNEPLYLSQLAASAPPSIG